MRRIPAFALLLTCAAIGLPATAATSATEHSCGVAGTSFDAPQGVHATGVSCVAARRLALSMTGAVALAAASVRITPAGAGAVKLGKTYTSLRAAGLLGKIGPGCELGGPRTRSAPLRAPLRGGVDLTLGTPRRVAAITVRAGATARGVGIGATAAAIRAAFPRVKFDHRGDATFGLTIARVPTRGGGRLEFGVDTTTKRVTLIGIPRIPVCD